MVFRLEMPDLPVTISSGAPFARMRLTRPCLKAGMPPTLYSEWSQIGYRTFSKTSRS